MASLLNIGVCGADGELATGKPFCDLIKGRMKGVIFADNGVTFSEADMASQTTFAAAVQTKSRAARGSRIYPIWNLNNFEDKTGDPNRGGVGNLTTKQIITSSPIPQFDIAHSGGELLHKKLLQLEVGSYDIFLVDSNNVVYGKATSTGELGGYTIYQNYVYPSKFIVSDAVNQFRFEVTLDSYQEYRDSASFFAADSSIADINGINNVVVTLFNQTTNVAKIKLVADGGKNLFDLSSIKTAMTTAGSIIATNKQTGASFTITSVAATDTTNKVFTVTLDNTAYGLLSSGDKVTIDMAAPSVLYANAIDGFESTGGVDVTHA